MIQLQSSAFTTFKSDIVKHSLHECIVHAFNVALTTVTSNTNDDITRRKAGKCRVFNEKDVTVPCRNVIKGNSRVGTDYGEFNEGVVTMTCNFTTLVKDTNITPEYTIVDQH